MPNAKDTPIQKKKILNYGAAGSGKTFLFTTIPGRKFMYMLDPSGLDSLTGEDIDYEPFFPEALSFSLSSPGSDKRGIPAKTDKGADPPNIEPRAYVEFERHLINSLDSGFFDNYDVIGFDSLSSLTAMLMDRILWMDKMLGKNPEIQHHNAIQQTMVNIFRRMTALQKHIYITAHSNTVQDSLTNRIIHELDIGKGGRRTIPRLLTDVWISYCDGEDSHGPQYSIITHPEKQYLHGKNSMSLNHVENVTIDLKRPRTEQGIGAMFKARGIT